MFNKTKEKTEETKEKTEETKVPPRYRTSSEVKNALDCILDALHLGQFVLNNRFKLAGYTHLVGYMKFNSDPNGPYPRDQVDITFPLTMEIFKSITQIKNEETEAKEIRLTILQDEIKSKTKEIESLARELGKK